MIQDSLKESLKKVCAVLNKHKVDYIVVGGAAVNFHGHYRASSISLHKPQIKDDIDFWYNPTNENYLKLVNALDELKVDTTDLKKLVFDPKKTFLKIPHATFHTDFLPVMAGLKSFSKCKFNAEKTILDGVDLRILSYEDLILNKKVVNREIDKKDIKKLDVKKNKKSGRGFEI